MYHNDIAITLIWIKLYMGLEAFYICYTANIVTFAVPVIV